MVLNRKNSLLFATHAAVESHPYWPSLTSTCRRHLLQLLVNLPSAPISELFAWLPDQWKLRQSDADSVDTPDLWFA